MKKQIIKDISSLLQAPAVQKASVFAVAFMVVGTVAYFGTQVQQDSHASVPAPAALYLSPETGSYTTGSTFTATIRATTGTEQVNAVQASLNYDPTKLEFVSMAEGTAFPLVAADSRTAGNLRVARSTSSGSVTGDNVVVTVTFKMLASSGSTSLAFDPAYSYIVRSSDSTNVMTSSAGASYTVKLPAPTISGVTPAAGPVAGGTTLTITGTNFRNGATVKVGQANATSVTVNSATQITATTPSHSAGGVKDVIVTNTDGQSAAKAGAFTYVLAPTISSVTPANGPVSGGTTVTISGTNFSSDMTVTFGGTAATSVTLVNSTSLTAVTPAKAAGTVDVVVRDSYNQSATKAGGYRYLNAAPTVSSITPTSGYVAGGLTVTITGSNFISGATVSFGGAAATNVTVVNGTTITAKTPARAVGAVSVVVSNPDNQSATLANAFTFQKSGDINNDNRVNALDLSALLVRDGQNYPPADFNADGIVGSADLAILLGAWTW